MLFTDIEGSTGLARAAGEAWPALLARHHAIIRGAIEAVGGYEASTDGDAFFATFTSAHAGVAAARSAQEALATAEWPATAGAVRVRMGIHTAEVEWTHGDYVGLEIHRAARVRSAARGGQVIITAAARAALAQPVDCDDLGQHRLKDFPEPTHLLHLVVAGRRADEYPPPATLDVRPTNLPAAGIDIVGRDTEIELIRDAFLTKSARIVTITGAGGAGKTTVALAAGRVLLDDYPDGVWLVRADTLADAAELVPAIAEPLWVRDFPATDLFDAVAAHLAETRTLLVLDNLEHLEGAGRIVAGLVARTRAADMLVTSRVPLRLAGERVMPLGPLPPVDACDLLLSRADAAGVSLDADSTQLRAAVADLCERLDRLPLAIELIAPRLRVLSPQQVVDRLDTLLASPAPEPDRPERHRSLRAAIEWSVRLLTGEAHRLFARLAVVRSPAPLDVVAEMFCWDIDVVDALGELVDHSLVHRAESGFFQPATVREAAAQHLRDSGEEEAARAAHATVLARLADKIGNYRGSVNELRVEQQLRGDSLAAMEWARAHDACLHRDLVAGIAPRLAVSGQIRRALVEVDAALAVDGLPACDAGRLRRVRGYLLLIAADAAGAGGEAEEAGRLLDGGDPIEHGRSLVVLSQALCAQGLLREGVDAARAALDRFRMAGDPVFLVRGFAELAQAQMAAGDIDGARAALDEAERHSDPAIHEATVLVASMRADLALAAADYAAAVELNDELLNDDHDYNAWVIASIMVAFSHLGEPEAALELAAVAEAMAKEMGSDVSNLIQAGEDIHSARQRARAALAADAADAAEQAGRDLPVGQRLVRAHDLVRRWQSRR